MRILAGLAVCVFAAALHAQPACACDPKDPETLKDRQCGLCAAAEKQPPDTKVFFTQDNSPRKPNRWLGMPREHAPGIHHLADLSAETRAELWRQTIAKARSLWGDQWGVATNGDKARTQCHLHFHIGKLIDGVEAGEFVVVNGPEDIPLPAAITEGLWIHPAGGKLHVHTGEQVAETVLLR
jgi:hypothetical protein